MAGTQITTYTTIITESMRGYQNITLTNWTNTNEPLIAEGGRTEIKGSLFKFDADEDVDPDADWAGFAMSTQIYGYYVVAGANVTSKLTTTAPTWSEEFGCWMDAGETYRYWGGIYKDSGGNYADKFIYAGRTLKYSYDFVVGVDGSLDLSGNTDRDKSITFASDATQLWDESEDEWYFNKSLKVDDGIETDGTKLKTEIEQIGSWNMPLTQSVQISHNSTISKIRDVSVFIYHNNELLSYPLDYHSFANVGGNWAVGTTYVILQRNAAGIFGTTNFNSTGINRGYVKILYEA